MISKELRNAMRELMQAQDDPQDAALGCIMSGLFLLGLSPDQAVGCLATAGLDKFKVMQALANIAEPLNKFIQEQEG